jgi:uncharacterized phage protein gp47/JayE
MSVRTPEEINKAIQNDFRSLSGKEYRPGSALGLFTDAVARSMGDAYQEIENAKNPHIYTNLAGENLDKMGTFVNVPRELDEDDKSYLHRIMNWTYAKAAANQTAIDDALLNLEYSSNAEYHPGVYGAGTGVVYVIPLEYEEETMNNALEEAKARVKDVISPESYTEFIIPTPKAVTIVAHLETNNGDVDNLHSVIAEKVKTYINALAPGAYMSVGQINKIGLETDNVEFFSVDGLYINNEYTTVTKVMQELETKLLFQEISWEDA